MNELYSPDIFKLELKSMKYYDINNNVDFFQ